MFKSALPVGLLAVFVACGPNPTPGSSVPYGGAETLPAEPSPGQHYAQTPWPSVHRDGSNSDYVPLSPTPNVEIAWQALEGAAVLVGPIIGPEGNLYATTGQGEGTSHLYAFDKAGTLLWQTPPMQSLDDFDYGAVVSAPIIDTDGHVYAGDRNQLWSFTQDGQVRWVTAYPDAGADGFLITPIFTAEGHVGGVTTDGVFLAYDRGTGALAYTALDLPGGKGPPATPAPPGLWQEGFMAPEFVQPLWDILFGRDVEVANTPAIHPQTGRIYMSATGKRPEDGVLYGIDTGATGARITFETPIGAGSGTSPAISPDGKQVYVVDETGELFAIDAETGQTLWTADNAQGQASPTIGPDGLIYTFDPEVGGIIAFAPEDGALKWQRAYTDLAKEHLGSSWFGDRKTIINSILTVTDNGLWAFLEFGYYFERGERAFSQPRKVVVAQLDRQTGDLIGWFPSPGSSSAFVIPDEEGNLYLSLGEVVTTISYYGVNPRLPFFLKSDFEPVGGIVALRPKE